MAELHVSVHLEVLMFSCLPCSGSNQLTHLRVTSWKQNSKPYSMKSFLQQHNTILYIRPGAVAGLTIECDMLFRIESLKTCYIVSHDKKDWLDIFHYLSGLDVCRCGPRLCAMATKFLETVTNRHGYDKMTPLQLVAEAQKPVSTNRSINRRSKFLTPHQMDLLKQLGESRHVWFGLRRHGAKKQVEAWLEAAVTQSSWLTERESDEETLRKEYLRLFQEIQYYEPDFVHDEMQRRRADAHPGTGEQHQDGGAEVQEA